MTMTTSTATNAKVNVLSQGTRVRLSPNPEEGWPEEFGHVEEYEGNDLYCVRVDEKFRPDDDPDGLREVLREELEVVP